MRHIFKRLFPVFLLLTVPPSAVTAADSYNSLLKKWTRHAQVYVWDNLEARLIWHATFFSDEFRRGRGDRVAALLGEPVEERLRREREEREEATKFDVFFLGLYAGSSQWPEIGKDDGQWRIVLEAGDRPAVEAVSFERLPVSQLERALYPYLDKWSEAYLVKFPKSIREGGNFRLRMAGIPAPSELVWK